jgi:carboxyl-terminal processing protease
VILDLRNKARGTLEQAVRTAGVLLGDQVIVSTKGRLAVTEQSYQGRARELVFKPAVPMVVLVDQGTARAAEIVAGALRDDAAATLLGAKTLGLCGLTKVFPLQDGSALVMTVAQCYTPKGKKIQGKGLEPQVAGRKLPSPGPSAKEAPKTVLPEQDPWVIQALELITSGKPRPVAKKSH